MRCLTKVLDIGITHRDLSLKNIIFSQDKQNVVLIHLENRWGTPFRSRPQLTVTMDENNLDDAGWSGRSDIYEIGPLIKGWVYANVPINTLIEWPVPLPLDAIVEACMKVVPEQRPSLDVLYRMIEAGAIKIESRRVEVLWPKRQNFLVLLAPISLGYSTTVSNLVYTVFMAIVSLQMEMSRNQKHISKVCDYESTWKTNSYLKKLFEFRGSVTKYSTTPTPLPGTFLPGSTKCLTNTDVLGLYYTSEDDTETKLEYIDSHKNILDLFKEECRV